MSEKKIRKLGVIDPSSYSNPGKILFLAFKNLFQGAL